MILTIEEYIKKYSNQSEYLLSLAKKLLAYPHIEDYYFPQFCGMLEWNNIDAFTWSGPFSGNYVFFKITDETENLYLRSISEINESEKTKNKFDSNNWPNGYVERILGENWFDFYLGKHLTRRSELTYSELLKLIASADKETLNFYLLKVKKYNKNLKYNKTEVSKELPVRFVFNGNDDCSMIKLFSDFQTAKECLNKLDINNSFKILSEYGFRFY